MARRPHVALPLVLGCLIATSVPGHAAESTISANPFLRTLVETEGGLISIIRGFKLGGSVIGTHGGGSGGKEKAFDGETGT